MGITALISTLIGLVGGALPRILGIIENFVMDTGTGELKHVLVIPDDSVEIKLFQTDPKNASVKSLTDFVAY